MKVYMMTDLEGVAGVVSFASQTYSDGRYYDRAQRLLTAEINAAIEGLLEAGVDDILVYDGHGPGAVWFEDLHPAAKLLHGRPTAHPDVRNQVIQQYDVGIMIGQHAMAGIQTGNLNHTQSSRAIDYYKLNGQLIGEIAQFALLLGAFGKPMIYLSGDDDACREAEALIPNVVTTSVKQGLGRNSAISVSAVTARQRIQQGVRQAIENHRRSPIQPLVWPGPFTMEKRYFHSDTADMYAQMSRAHRVDGQTIRLTSDNLLDVLY